MEISDAEMDRIRKEMAQSSSRMEVSDADKNRIRREMSKAFGRMDVKFSTKSEKKKILVLVVTILSKVKTN